MPRTARARKLDGRFAATVSSAHPMSEQAGPRALAKVAVVVAFLAAFLVHSGALACAFLPADEGLAHGHPLIARAGTLPPGAFYRPVRTLSFALDRAVWERHPAGYHLTNVLLHGAVAVLALLSAVALGVPRGAALAGMALFVVHPVVTATVTPVAGRAELLATLLALLAFRAYLAWDATGEPRFAVACGLAGVAAVYAKESAFALALVALAHAWLLHAGDARRAHVRRALALAGVLAVAVLHARWLAPPELPAREPLAVASIGTVARAFASYASLVLWPAVLSADYSHAVFPPSPSPLEPALIALVAYALAVAVLARRWPPAAFTLAAYALALSPAFALALTPERLSERALYLPCAIALIGLAALSERVLAPHRPLALGIVVALWCALGVRAGVRTRDFADAFAIASATVRDHPECARSRTNLGLLLEMRGRLAAAEGEYRAALALSPEDATTANNLGTLLMQRGALAEAEAVLEHAVAHDPAYATGFSNLGAVECERGRLDEAEEHLKRALALDPDYPAALSHLGMTLRRKGQLAQAEAAYARSIALDSRAGATYNNLGALYLDMRRGEDAEAAFAKAIALEPHAAHWHVNLARALASTGKTRAAEDALIRASSIEPDSATVQQECARVARELKLERLSKHFLEKAARARADKP